LTVPDLQDLRSAFKKAFTGYYVALRSPGIADPSEAFSACLQYLDSWRRQVGTKELMYRLDDETTQLAGQTEQELIQRMRRNPSVVFESDPALSDDLEDRMRECFEYALDKLVPTDVTEEDE
jgi:acyl-homoserine lactone acylase PvdQ